jgi:hypothetical protein
MRRVKVLGSRHDNIQHFPWIEFYFILDSHEFQDGLGLERRGQNYATQPCAAVVSAEEGEGFLGVSIGTILDVRVFGASCLDFPECGVASPSDSNTIFASWDRPDNATTLLSGLTRVPPRFLTPWIMTIFLFSFTARAMASGVDNTAAILSCSVLMLEFVALAKAIKFLSPADPASDDVQSMSLSLHVLNVVTVALTVVVADIVMTIILV